MIRAAPLAIALAGAAHAQASDIPRATDGRRDLQAYWSNEFLKPLERIDGATAVVASKAEAKSLVDGILVQRSKHQLEAAPLMATFRKTWNETPANWPTARLTG